MPITLILNGKHEEFKKDMSVLEFLEIKDISPEMVTIEVNDEIIQRQNYREKHLKNNDRVETVFFMGGGLLNDMPEIKIDQRIDLRGVTCPMNFVKTVLKLEEMKENEILEVMLDGGDPAVNVPRSVKEEGHQIISVEKESDGGYKLLIKK